MNVFSTFSRVLAVSAVAFVVNAGAKCPIFEHKSFDVLNKKSTLIIGSIAADHMCDKNDHLKKAFIGTSANAVGTKKSSAEFGERLVVDYTIRKGCQALNVNGLRDAALKQCDVLPEGAVRDNVNPVVKGAAEFATHPEFLTYLAMEYLLPVVISALKGGNNSN